LLSQEFANLSELRGDQGQNIVQADEADEMALAIDHRQSAIGTASHDFQRLVDGRLFIDGLRELAHDSPDALFDWITAFNKSTNHEIAVGHDAQRASILINNDQGTDIARMHSLRGGMDRFS
jgi:hypothetical protein